MDGFDQPALTMTHEELKEFLDTKVDQYNLPFFLESDPIQIPHKFSAKEDIEISAFLTATIAWGNRKSIINNAHKMISLLDYAPLDFVLNHTLFEGFRTPNIQWNGLYFFYSKFKEYLY